MDIWYPNITFDIMKANKDRPWDYQIFLSRNENICWDIMDICLKRNIDCIYLSANKNITWEIISWVG